MRSLLTTATLTAALLVALPSTVFAQDAEDKEIANQAHEHYNLGVAAFKAGKWAEAIKELKKSYTLKKLPALAVKVAQTYEKLNDWDNAMYWYKKYLAEAPADAKDRGDIQKAIAAAQAKKDAPADEAEAASKPGGTEPAAPAAPAAEAQKPAAEAPKPAAEAQKPVAEAPKPAPPTPPKKGSGKAATPAAPATPAPVVEAPKPSEPAPTAAAPAPDATKPPVDATPAPAPGGERRARSEWAHTAIDSAPPGSCLDVRVQTPVMKGVKVMLYYRGQGTADFQALEMKRKGVEKVARIPATAMTGKSIQYYIEAKDSTGAVVKTAGTRVDPNIVFLDKSTAPMCGDESQIGVANDGSDDVDEEQRRKAAEEREKCDKNPLLCTVKEKDAEGRRFVGPGHAFSSIGWAGIGLAAGGLLIGAVGGGVSLYYANQFSSYVNFDGTHRVGNSPTGALDCAAQLKIQTTPDRCFFNNPDQNTPTDSYYQSKGQLAGIMAPVAIGLGGALIAGGVAMIVWDYVTLHPSNGSSGGKKKKVVPTDEEGAESSLLRRIRLVPTLSPSQVGLVAGFQF